MYDSIIRLDASTKLSTGIRAENISNKNWPEIDGLRAVAILLVIAFHAGVPQLSGGFVGVDVFFVISGFLITGLLAQELNRTGRIDILGFYARRVRRLLPALVLVLLFTLCAGAFLLVPVGQVQQLAQSAIAGAGFFANIFFWRRQSSYFAGAAEEMPLLHLWTLAVEEQFYIVWPLAMMAVTALARRLAQDPRPWLIASLVAVSLGSFLASWWLTPSYATLTFYTTPFRAWEFGLGALLALTGVGTATGEKRPDVAVGASLFLVVAGIVAVMASGLFFGGETVFPGAAAAVPALGATAILAGVRLGPGTAPARLLAAAPMVVIGKLSYSWYLWHWPLLALARAALPGQDSILRDIPLVLLALVLSALTFRYVEEPVRRRQPGPFAYARSSVAAGGGLMAACVFLAALLWGYADWRTGDDPILKAAARAVEEKAPVAADCGTFRLPFAGLAPDEACTIGKSGGSPFVLLWGDSHAHHYIPGFALWAAEASARLLPRTMGSCKPQITRPQEGLAPVAREGAASCVAFNDAVRASLPRLRAAGVTTVVLAGRWSVAGPLQKELGDWRADLAALITDLRSQGFSVVLFAETPPRGLPVPQCVARNGPSACDRPRAEVDAWRRPALTVLRALAAETDGVRLWDPIEEVCDHETCPAMRDGQVLYSDDSHLSVAGSRMLAPAIGQALEWPRGEKVSGE